MTDDEFRTAFLFGAHDFPAISSMDFLLVKAIAERLHDAGLDWFIADKDYCFGKKVVGARAANVRLGRLWRDDGKATLTFRTTYRSQLQSFMGACDSLGKLEDDLRYRFAPEGFRVLIADDKLIEALRGLADFPQKAGRWRRDYLNVA